MNEKFGPAVAALALKQVGIHADKETNEQPYGAWAEDRGGPPNGQDENGKNVAWCATGVSWTWFTATEGKVTICGGMPIGKGEVFDGGCSWIPTIMQWASKRGKWSETDRDPGDLIVFQLPGTKHIGMVVKIPDGGTVECVEYNYSHGVHHTSYDLDDPRILGYVRMEA